MLIEDGLVTLQQFAFWAYNPFVEGEVQKLLNAVETSTHTGLRDRVLLATLAYTFARIGSVVNLKVEDYYPSGKRFLLSSLVVLEFGVRPIRLKQAGGDRRVNTFKEFDWSSLVDRADSGTIWEVFRP